MAFEKDRGGGNHPLGSDRGLNCVQVNVLVWICVQQKPISILVLTAYFTVLLSYQNELVVLHL